MRIKSQQKQKEYIPYNVTQRFSLSLNPGLIACRTLDMAIKPRKCPEMNFALNVTKVNYKSSVAEGTKVVVKGFGRVVDFIWLTSYTQ